MVLLAGRSIVRTTSSAWPSCAKSIDLAAAVGCRNVITFTGMREKGISDEQGARNCVDCWRQVIGYAEQKKVDLCLEHLNSRDSSHPMKGHPGYFGDHVDFLRGVDPARRCAEYEVAVRHLPRANHGRRRDPAHSGSTRI